MTELLYTLGLVAFIVAILVSIGLHELGHMVPAKIFGAKVPQYFIGFGRTLWSRRVGETEYGVKAFPLGGFVKIVGMLPPGADAPPPVVEEDAEGNKVVRVRGSSTGMFTQLISDARAAEAEFITPEDEPRLFYKLASWKKVVVMAAGPLTNIVIAFFLFWGLYATYGNPLDTRTTPVVSQVLDCVVPYAEDGRQCTPRDPVTPAKQAGIRAGDEFLAVNGVPVTSWEQTTEQIRAIKDGEVTLTILRDGETLDITTNTTVTALPTSADDPQLVDVGFLGVRATSVNVTGGPIYTLDQMGTMAGETLTALATLPVKVWHVGLSVVGLEERSIDSPVSIVGGGRIAGEVTSSDRIALEEKLVMLVGLVAGFNFFIGAFNLLPLLPLDGGHIAGALWEGIRRAIYRLRGRPDPGYVDVAKLLPVAYVVGALMLVMGVVLIVADIVRPLHIT